MTYHSICNCTRCSLWQNCIAFCCLPVTWVELFLTMAIWYVCMWRCLLCGSIKDTSGSWCPSALQQNYVSTAAISMTDVKLSLLNQTSVRALIISIAEYYCQWTHHPPKPRCIASWYSTFGSGIGNSPAVPGWSSVKSRLCLYTSDQSHLFFFVSRHCTFTV